METEVQLEFGVEGAGRLRTAALLGEDLVSDGGRVPTR